MAAQIQPPEAPITSPPTTTDIVTEPTTTAAAAAIPPAIASATAIGTATALTGPTITTAQPYAENTGQQPLAPKRQRRPSVRLGEIGDQPATLAYDSHGRRPTRHPSWRLPKDSSSAAPSSKSVKARSLTNLVNNGGAADSHDNNNNSQEFEERNNINLYVDGSTEFGIRKTKAKRGTTTKRVRSNWLPRPDDGGAEGDNSREDGDEGYRDFDPDSDNSPVHSVDNDLWRGPRRHIGQPPQSLRVSENDAIEFDNDRKLGTCEGVRSWLIELGLSRYAPMFEIHEVDDEVLPMLTLEDLKDMGINAVGSRRKMYSAIQKLRKGFP